MKLLYTALRRVRVRILALTLFVVGMWRAVAGRTSGIISSSSLTGPSKLDVLLSELAHMSKDGTATVSGCVILAVLNRTARRLKIQ